MKKLITFIACIVIAASMAGCEKKNADNSQEQTQTQTQQEQKKITKIGDTVIDDATYNFFYNMAKSQYADDDAKAISAANDQIKFTYMPIELGKKLKLDAASKEQIKSQIKSSYKSEDEYQKFLQERQITEQFIDTYAEANAYYEAINNYVKANEKSSTDSKQYFKDNYLRAKHVLIMTKDMDDATKQDKKTLAEDILARAKGGEDFDSLVQQYSEDPGSKSQPDGYVFPEGQMVTEFYEGTKNIGIGEYTLVESEFGYHVIKRLALDETPELFDKFYADSQVEQQIGQKQTDEFIEKKADELKIKVNY